MSPGRSTMVRWGWSGPVTSMRRMSLPKALPYTVMPISAFALSIKRGILSKPSSSSRKARRALCSASGRDSWGTMETPALMCEVLRRTSSLVLRAELAQGARKGDHLEMLSPPSALRLGLLSWCALVTVCSALAVAALCHWRDRGASPGRQESDSHGGFVDRAPNVEHLVTRSMVEDGNSSSFAVRQVGNHSHTMSREGRYGQDLFVYPVLCILR
ncbi:uncharacterized protein B0H64DRAFT_52360 [Chaetomium fimeti]|uniref:Uncharacterized protein n=1 Tax=Chaetomium fimeti TaxID=1854472 RepID=A0AAE0H651_9PEZI|nr:hypothetical protein B0H64DRAFT_52360 [Chaetomium fimeti]